MDTYDYKTGITSAISTARELEKKGHRLKAIRLDSGDLLKISRFARRSLDKAGLDYVRIFASGNLDEFRIARLLKRGAPIDSFGVGTKMGVSLDAPYSDVIYKLSEITDDNGVEHPVMKLSQDKITYPGKKQIFRIRDKKGNFSKDILALESEDIKGEPLLVKVMEQGKVVYRNPGINKIRENVLNALKFLPARYKGLRSRAVYPVQLSGGLKKMIRDVKKGIRK